MDETYGLKEESKNGNWIQNSLRIAPFELFNNSCESSKLTEDPEIYKRNYKVIIHSSGEIPTAAIKPVYVFYGEKARIILDIKSEKTSENLRILDPDTRRCYFEGERILKYFKSYSRQYCKIECISDYRRCNIIEAPSETPMNNAFCQIWSYKRFTEKFPAYRNCKCYPACNEVEYELRKEMQEKLSKHDATVITFAYKSTLIQYSERDITYSLTNCKMKSINYCHK